jgi:hypothetical protein
MRRSIPVKKTLVMILSVLLVLSLGACGSEKVTTPPTVSEESPEPEEMILYRKYSSIIDALERGDYEGAIGQITEMMPATPEPEVRVVSITPNNFFDYYEIVDMQPDELTYSYDAYGKISAINPYLGRFTIRLKPEYTLAENRESRVTMGYTLKYVTYDLVDVDFESGTYIIEKNEADKRTVNLLCDEEIESRTVEGSEEFWVGWTGFAMCGSGNSTTTGGLFAIERDKHYDYFKFVLPTDFQLIRCEGTLYLVP